MPSGTKRKPCFHRAAEPFAVRGGASATRRWGSDQITPPWKVGEKGVGSEDFAAAGGLEERGEAERRWYVAAREIAGGCRGAGSRRLR